MITEQTSARPSNHHVGRAGLYRVAAEIELRCFDVRVDREPGAAPDVLTLQRRRNVVGTLRVRTTRYSPNDTRGWQGRVDEDFMAVNGWVFVDLPATGEATFYPVPSEWLAKDIGRRNEEYLREHGNGRPRNPDTKHHKIEVEHLEDWRGKWDFIERLG